MTLTRMAVVAAATVVGPTMPAGPALAQGKPAGTVPDADADAGTGAAPHTGADAGTAATTSPATTSPAAQAPVAEANKSVAGPRYRDRWHSTNGHLSPNEYERRHHTAKPTLAA